MRVATKRLLRPEPNSLKHVLDEAACLTPGACESKIRDRLRQDMIDFVKGVVCVIWVLKDHLDVASKGATLRAGHARERLAPIQDFASRGRDHAQQQTRQRGLAATTLADDRGNGGWLSVDAQREVVQ